MGGARAVLHHLSIHPAAALDAHYVERVRLQPWLGTGCHVEPPGHLVGPRTGGLALEEDDRDHPYLVREAVVNGCPRLYVWAGVDNLKRSSEPPAQSPR